MSIVYIRLVGTILFSFVLLACAHHPVNPPLTHYEPDGLFANDPNSPSGNSDELLVILTFSGGGARASALSYGVLEELADTIIQVKGHDQRLLDEVDMISSVSGGSFTAAYYGLFGERIFVDFEQRYLKKDVERALNLRMFSPVNWIRLASPYFHRSELAAEYYDKYIFDGGTFADIYANGTPVIINATNMTQETRFGFDQEQFSWICSDLMRLPVSRAVAASSAVPVFLSPVTLRNYAGTCDYQPPDRIQHILQTNQFSSREYHQAAAMASYLNREEQPYIHLYDGGLSDNLGLRSVIDSIILSGGAPRAVLQSERLSQTQKVIFIVVNAQTKPDTREAQSARGPSISAVIKSAISVPLNRYNFETIALLSSSFEDWKKQISEARCSGEIQSPDPGCEDIFFYLVEVSFDALTDVREQAYLKGLSSSVSLPNEAIDRLRAAARQILSESDEFQAFLRDVRSAEPVTTTQMQSDIFSTPRNPRLKALPHAGFKGK